MNTTLTFEEGTSSKFYSLLLEGNVLTIRYGRIGSAGQEKVQSFKTAAEARQQYEALLAEKKKKGYIEPGPAASADAGSKPAPKPRPEAAARQASPVEAEITLPAPALADPPAPGLDLTVFRSGPIPVPERDATPFESGDFVIQGYTISFGDDGAVIITDARGKKLKSVPDKLRKHEDYQALMRGRKDDRARERRARRVLEDRMIAGTPLAGDEVAWLVDDEAFAPLLKGLLVVPRAASQGAPAGLLVAWDRDRGLGLLPVDYDARWVGWIDTEIVHPMKLGDALPWQDLLIDLGIQQGLVQIFRELKTVPAAQRNLTESSMLSGRETRSAAVIERALGEDGWTTRRGMARRKLSLHTPEGVQTVEAWFDYGECYMPSDPTTTGSFGFFGAGTAKPLKLLTVPAVLLSEIIRSLEVALAEAGAKKEGGEEEEEGEGDKDHGGDGEDGDDPTHDEEVGE